ncbi:Uncharacterized protein conserved in bacteria [Brevibacterium casei]|uniref:UDP-glucose 4-epimerase n=2 Tax=Brevibacterium casei TaxID=33889 RepID=A0A269ZCS1_9MICO|nr:UDP-glucose 4-epimerase [Brevibacterium casei]VEW15220.1 Uncharacterized protein conserved in bacteria [Brevibacterium casei]
MSEQIDTAKVGDDRIPADRSPAESTPAGRSAPDEYSEPADQTAPTALESSPTIEGETKSRVAMTQATVDLLGDLVAKHGQLMFHQSGGCCDGSSPMCFPEGDFLTSDADVLLGHFDLPLPEADADGTTTSGIDFWMSAEQFAYWKHTHLTVDVVPGRGAGFSVESPTGNRFIIRSTLMDVG